MRTSRTSLRSRDPLLPPLLRLAAIAVVAIALGFVASPLAGGSVFAIGVVGVITYEAIRPDGAWSPRRRS